MRGRVHRKRRGELIVAAALLTGLTGCGWFAPPDQDPEQNPSPSADRSASPSSATNDPTPSGPVHLAAPMELAIVTDTGQAPCAEGSLPSPDQDECLQLGDGMEVTELEELAMGEQVAPDGSTSAEQVLNLTLTDADGEAFYDLTTRAAELPQPRIAMVVDGEVVSAPMLSQPIPGGEVQIAGWDEAEEFVAEAQQR